MIGPIPARVNGTVKAELLGIIDTAVAGGWSAAKACSVLGLDRQRAWRWLTRRQAGLSLDDTASGGNPIHRLLDWEQTEILALYEEWADADRSHRKLAHRGSYENRVWVSPSTVDRVLARNNLSLAGETRPSVAAVAHAPSITSLLSWSSVWRLPASVRRARTR